MIIKVNRIEFLKKLKMIEKAISENKIKPIISCAYIETRGNQLFFCGTNLETTITTTMECNEVIEGGKIVFQHQLVEEYLKELKEEEVVFNVMNENLVIETTDSSSEFSLMNPEDYPKILVSEDFDSHKKIFTLTTLELAEIFEKTKYAAASTSEKLDMNCIRLESEGKFLKFITTDTYRMVYLKKELEEINQDLKVSIPLNSVEALTKLFRSIENSPVDFYFINKQIYFQTKEALIVSRIIDLVFPDYTGILNNNSYDKKLKITAETFIKVLKRTIIFVRNNSESKYGATFNFENDKMEVNGVNEVAKINEELKVDYIGENIIIALNTKFLFDFIQNLEKDKDMSMELIDSRRFVKIKSCEDDNYVYILMPLALRD